MGSMLFIVGSAVGAALALFVSRRQPSRSTVVVLNGVAGGLLGILISASMGSTAPAVEAGLGFLGTAAPLTLCMTSLRPLATTVGISSPVRHVAATLALSLIYGISCAASGFMLAEGVRQISVKENGGKYFGCPPMTSLRTPGAPRAAFPQSL